MCDNTPTDGTKNTRADAAASPGETARTHDPAEETAGTAREDTAFEQEPLVIDYDAMNANLSATEPGAERGAEPGDEAPSLAGAHADSSSASTVPASSTPASSTTASSTTASSTTASSAPAEPTAPVAPTVLPAVLPVAPGTRAAPLLVDGASAAPAPVAPSAQAPIYVQAPTKPRDRSNRGGGILIALLATAVFALLYSVAAFAIIGRTSTTLAATTTGFSIFAALPVFYIPIIFFFLAFTGLIALVNRGGWWAYVLFGFLVAVIVYFSYIGGALLGLVFDGTIDSVRAADLSRFVASLWLNPGAIAAGLIAREVPIWFGAWIARRGRRVSARNLEARTEYERLLADGPQFSK